jgi:hypothetical protein
MASEISDNAHESIPWPEAAKPPPKKWGWVIARLVESVENTAKIRPFFPRFLGLTKCSDDTVDRFQVGY